MKLTKSDFLLYLEAPLHLWADKNSKLEKTTSAFEINLMDQGYEVEKLAKEYLEKFVVRKSEDEKLLWQESFSDKQYAIRTDALVHKPGTDSYDLYEIKSGTNIKPENYYDVAFQFLILNKQIKIDNIFLLHLNRDYVRYSQLDLEHLFLAEDITDKVYELKMEVDTKRKEALSVSQSETSDGIEHCYKPQTCPCPELCHPNLPMFSIYDIPRITKKKKIQLLEMGIYEAKNIPDSFPLTPKQCLIVNLAKTNQEHIEHEAIRHEVERLSYPLYFLDYETYNAAIPLFDGYHPQQQMVFQYSLHKMESEDGDIKHTEHLSITQEEPSKSLLEQLSNELGELGTVFVWSKGFEMTRNKEMALIHPEYADFLSALNQRIYDLADFIKLAYYLHPDFKGSWSIKNVLPVMVPELSYQDMQIGKGDQAMMAWWEIVSGKMPAAAAEKTREALLKYCELDTWAMVKIWKSLQRKQ